MPARKIPLDARAPERKKFPKKASPFEAARAKRQAAALTLRSAGASYREIAETLGLDEYQAHNDVREAIRHSVPADVAQEQLALELDRLDRLQRTYFMRAVGIVDGRQVAPDLEAAKFVLAVIEQRSKLLGLNHVVLDIRSAGEELPATPQENLLRIAERVRERQLMRSNVIDVESEVG